MGGSLNEGGGEREEGVRVEGSLSEGEEWEGASVRVGRREGGREPQ